jgi:TonB family protein
LLGPLLAYRGGSLAALFSDDGKLQAGSFEGMVDGSGTGPAGSGIGLRLTGSGAGPGYGPLASIGPDGVRGTCDANCQAAAGRASALRTHATITPQVGTGVVHTQGTLDKEIVRRIIRQHLNEVKYCYELQLPRHPDLAGRITVQFTIAAEGKVTASLVQTSSLNNAAVESCIVQATRRWEFPRRNAGLTIVSYPFVLVPAGAP